MGVWGGGRPRGKCTTPAGLLLAISVPAPQTHGASQVMSASRVLVTSKTETGAERADTCFDSAGERLEGAFRHRWPVI